MDTLWKYFFITSAINCLALLRRTKHSTAGRSKQQRNSASKRSSKRKKQNKKQNQCSPLFFYFFLKKHTASLSTLMANHHCRQICCCFPKAACLEGSSIDSEPSRRRLHSGWTAMPAFCVRLLSNQVGHGRWRRNSAAAFFPPFSYYPPLDLA